MTRTLLCSTVLCLTTAFSLVLEARGGTPHPSSSFFATSIGNGANGGNYGGLGGADTRCANLAAAVGLDDRTWAAYLSGRAQPFDPNDPNDPNNPVINARDRIGDGPWFNVAGTLIATDVTDLHTNGIPVADVIDENGDPIPKGAHDILTGSGSDGRLDPLGANCQDFRVSEPTSYTAVGHADGGGVGQGFSVSWNAAHLSMCDEDGLNSTAGEGRLYCFSPNGGTLPTPTPDPNPSSTPTPSPSATASSTPTPTSTAPAGSSPTPSATSTPPSPTATLPPPTSIPPSPTATLPPPTATATLSPTPDQQQVEPGESVDSSQPVEKGAEELRIDYQALLTTRGDCSVELLVQLPNQSTFGTLLLDSELRRVRILDPSPGIWTLRVSAAASCQEAQRFALVSSAGARRQVATGFSWELILLSVGTVVFFAFSQCITSLWPDRARSPAAGDC